ncbi:MAG: hypothetical protein GY934_12910 [Gammaproteobacteria bacterium]|nr:hypothetical protein [Gammaproteobacteria bacterium]
MIEQWLKRLTGDGADRQVVGRVVNDVHPAFAQFEVRAVTAGEQGFGGRVMC